MSIDFKIQNPCDHQINWERVSFPVDRMTFIPSYVVGSTASLSLRINNIVKDSSTYSVYFNSESLSTYPKYYVKLKEPCKFYYPIVELKYNTISAYCPKCANTGLLDDFIYGTDKDAITVKNEFLLIQTLEKLIITKLGSNKYYSWIGTTLHTLNGRKITDISYFKTKISEDIRKAVDDLKKVQSQYMNTNRDMSPGELFGQLLNVDVSQPGDDPTMLQILVNFTAQSGKTIQYEQLMELSSFRQR